LLLSGADLTDYERERFGAAGVNLSNAHEVDSNQDIETLVAGGLGIAVAPRHAMKSDAIRHICLPSLDVERTIAVYGVAGRPRSREATALLNLLRGKQWDR
jgi:DNA-binding transcriptional LysR family regulator